jgi:hypothetical protein
MATIKHKADSKEWIDKMDQILSFAVGETIREGILELEACPRGQRASFGFRSKLLRRERCVVAVQGVF